MKNAIIQYYIPFNGIGKKSKLEYKYQLYPEKIPEWAEISSKKFKEYAKENDADYFLFQDKFIDCEELHFQALRLYLDPILDSYDKILYCDIDVVPKNMKENIFNLDVEDVAGWSETKSGNYKVPINWQGQSHFFNQRCNFFDSKAVYLKNGMLRMINSGVMVWTKKARLFARENFIHPNDWWNYKNPILNKKLTLAQVGHSSLCLDQPFFNAMINKFDMKVKLLEEKWNRFPTKNESYECNFAHYVSDYRYDIPKIFKGD
jgi:hypothetical protein